MTRRFLAFFPAFVWILIQTTMAISVSVPLASASGQPDGERFQDLIEAGLTEIVLCDGNGPVVIDLTKGIPDEIPTDGDRGCKWCQGFGNTDLAVGAGVELSSLSPARTTIMLPEERPVTFGRAALGFSPRAPPV
ncbi:MAG: hypothetical protein AAF501_14250 [Pseudomonadota bacterium]